MKRYCLPNELKGELRKLHGELYRGDGQETARKILKDLKNPTKVISVGDIVTYNLLTAGVVPDISFVDERTKRVPASDHILHGTKHPRFKTITVENPPGIITEGLLQGLSEAIESDNPVRIFVKGEEDLAALPAIAMAPISSVVIYGLPDEGAVVVRVTQSKKKEIQSLLDRMKCKEEE
ncbi:MAG: GTP-dependent dephospho-CoA kinase family protein [Candidatus Methanoperedens sp.]|nr:GTP-dependent dephospho-CoA kinase family protein [Candidatus Methanoperedens sp.]